MSAAAAQVVNLGEVRTKDSVDDIIKRAEERARERGVSYGGLLTPEEAWTLAQKHRDAKLVDIRTNEELHFIGRVPGALEIQWILYEGWSRNPRFVADVKRKLAPNDFILLLCRSGLRSRDAAELLAREGFCNSFNVLEGFEGDKNADGMRVIVGVEDD